MHRRLPACLQRFGESTARGLNRVAVLHAVTASLRADLMAATDEGQSVLHLLA